MWDKILKFLNDNKDALGWLFGSGVFLVVARFAVWLIKEYRLRKIRSNDNFPFKIIPPNSNVAKEILGGTDDDPLADRNIPYQQRIQGRNTRRELEELIEDNRWILITGRTGLGKTREAVQLAQSLNNEGWTILYLTREAWLDAPPKLPNHVPERKLVFFFDDLNKKCLSSKAEIRPNPNESLTLPLYEPFQTRLQRTLEAFDIFCGKSEIRVIATARNEKTSEFDEPSEWDKLGWTKYNDLWEIFKLVDLPEPDKTVEQQLLGEVAGKANILIKADELSTLAKRNDGTFRNLVENLSSAKAEGSILSSENFRDTLKGTWQKRYQKAIQKYSEAKYLYDSIDLLRNIGIQLRHSTVMKVAEIISDENFFQRIKVRRRYSSALKQLIRTENILHPRDGQIEAKGYKVDPERFVDRLYVPITVELESKSGIGSRILYTIVFLFTPINFFNVNKITFLERIFGIFTPVAELLNDAGHSYNYFGYPNQGLKLLRKGLELRKWSISNLFSRTFARNSWIGLGDSYFQLKQYDEAISAYNRAIQLTPKHSASWSKLGKCYIDGGRFEDALPCFLKATEFSPKSARLWNLLGVTYCLINHFDEAIEAYQKAVEFSPDRGMYRASLISILRKLGREVEAVEQEKVARSFMEKETEYNRSCFESICGNTEESLRLLKIALARKQTDIEWVRRDPDFDFIRDDSRFKELVGLE